MAKRTVIPLTDTQIKNAKSKDKDYLLADGHGLFLNIKSIGTKVWTVRYTIDGKQNKTSIGNYPNVPLQDARYKNKEYQSKAKQGISPVMERKEAKQAIIADKEGQLHEVIKRYLTKIKESLSKTTFEHTQRRFERDILPFFATYKPNSLQTIDNIASSTLIGNIKHNDLLRPIKAIEDRGSIQTAHRVLAECGRLWLFAINEVTPYADINIVANIDKRHALKKVTKTHFASTTDPKELKRFMDFADKFNRSYTAKYAMKLLPYVFLRAGNIAELEWSEIDFEKKLITIKADKMKISSNGDFILPITDRAIEILKEIEPFTKDCKYVFRSDRDPNKPISNNTLSKALRENGFKGIITPHGFRATFSSIAYESTHIHGLSQKAIEACLHHAERNEVAGAYNYKANYLSQMTILMTWWANFLDEIRAK
jgi:integrase